MDKSTVKARWQRLMAYIMKGSLQMVDTTAKEFTRGQMASVTQGNIKMVNQMAREYLPVLMDIVMKASF